MPRPSTVGELKRSGYQPVSVKEELRRNLIRKLKAHGGAAAPEKVFAELFPGIVGYGKTVLPQIVNAVLSKHDFILLGLRGQAKTRLARAMTNFLDEETPVLSGFPLNEDPLAPISNSARAHLVAAGDSAQIHWMTREERYREKLATPDVTIADLIGDIDPIKAANKRLDYGSEEVIHYGIVPRSNRGIFCLNELPDLPTRIQVGFLNILQEKDIQIRGFPVRLPMDILMIFTANPEDYTNRGSIITPLKDRIDSQIITHYPQKLSEAMAITQQEAWAERESSETGTPQTVVPDYLMEVIDEVAFQARKSEFLDQSSGVSARLAITLLENVISSAERRGLLCGEYTVCVRPVDFQSAVSAVTGKVELVYEGEQQGALNVARHLIGRALKSAFDRRFPNVYKGDQKDDPSFGPYKPIIQYFAHGGRIDVSDLRSTSDTLRALSQVDGLEAIAKAHIEMGDPALELPAAMEFVLEGLHQSRLLAKDDLENSAAYRDMLGSMFEGLDEGGPPNPPRERGKRR